jgi:hypothetical protein
VSPTLSGLGRLAALVHDVSGSLLDHVDGIAVVVDGDDRGALCNSELVHGGAELVELRLRKIGECGNCRDTTSGHRS